ncbi:hypothetical protein ACJX0J_041717, partial [Zea mays]
MDPFNNKDVRPPLRELSSNTLEGGHVDARQRKRERERGRYAAMSDEKKNELKKRRESRKNENIEYSKDECPEVPVSDGSIIDLTKSCDNTQGGRTDARQCKRERERARYAAMSVEKKRIEELSSVTQKRKVVHHEYSKDDCPNVAIGDGSIIDCTIPCGITLGYNWLGGCDDARQRKRERKRARYATMSAEKKNELKRHRQSSKNENVVHHERSKGASAQTGHQHDSNPSSEVLDAREHKRIREQIRFATLTREQRALRNTKPCQKSARENYSRRQQEMLAQDSIAIENPKFTPELVWSSADSQPPNVSLSSSKDMIISKLSATPFVYASLQTKDVDMDKMTQSPRKQRHKHHVSSSESQSLISRQNQKFQSAIRRNFATATRDHEMEGECTSPCPVTAPHSDKMTEGADVGMQQQITPNVTTNDADEGVLFVENHDEDVLFEEDDDEEDGYLFAGQDGESIEDIEIDETQDAFTVTPDVPDPYDKIDLAPFETPPQLRRLWECSDADARHFRDNIRFLTAISLSLLCTVALT